MTNHTPSSLRGLNPLETMKGLGLAAFCLFAFSVAAFGRDSAWLLGDNGKVAVTTFEHRAGEGRATMVTLIYGEHILRGTLNNVDSGRLTLKENAAEPENNYRFTGTISVSYEKNQIILKGKLTVQDTEVENYNVTLRCKVMNAD